MTQTKNGVRGPLDGITILDMTIWQNGPWGTVMLADMGATVIKIEDPVKGDPGRTSALASLGPRPFNAYFETMNRSKRSMTLDLKRQEAREIFYKMAEKADVITQNFRKGVVKKLGVDYETIRKINPKIVYASVNGYGPEGPDASEGVFDILGLARGGFLWMSSRADKDISYRIAGGLADQTGGITLAYAVSMGIIARERFGVGQHIETSQLGGQLMLQAMAINQYLINGDLPPGKRRTEAGNPLFNIYRCAGDAWLAMGCIQSDRYWHDFVQVLGIEQFEDDPRFNSLKARQANAVTLIEILDKVFLTRTPEEWMKALSPRGVNCTRVQSYPDLPNDPQVMMNKYIVDVPHPTAGKLREVGVPFRMSETPGGPKATAPEFGQHTEEVLLEHGYDWGQIEAWRASGVI